MRDCSLLAMTLTAFALGLAPGAAPPALPSDASDLFPPAYSAAAGRSAQATPATRSKDWPRPAASTIPPAASVPFLAPVRASESAPARPRIRIPVPAAPVDSPIQRTSADEQPPAAEAPVEALALPDSSLPGLAPAPTGVAAPVEGGQPLGLQAALYGAITNNPDLISLRNSNVASPEAVEVARKFPTTLNPTVWIDYRPITLVPRDTFGTSGTAGTGPFYHYGQNYILFSIRQPIELGHQTTHRYAIARAALSQQRWTVVQAELVALVQTYRFFQTAAYRREKLRVAQSLSDSNDRLVQTLQRRLDANQVPPADVVFAEVENEAMRQQVDVARQDYAIALADLRNQVGLPDTAGTSEPLGEFVMPKNIPPLDEKQLIQLALCTRPEIHAARSAAAGALAAINLARGDRIPTPVVGPQYAMDEAGIQYFGLILVSAIPVLNNGTPLVRQREADYRRSLTTLQQVEKRTIIQVKAAAAKWNAAHRLVNQTSGLTESVRTQVARMEQLFEANQTDLTRLFQTRQRLIQLENAALDALWQATQAQADLLNALGAPNLIASLHEPAPAFASTNAPLTPAPAPAIVNEAAPTVRR